MFYKGKIFCVIISNFCNIELYIILQIIIIIIIIIIAFSLSISVTIIRPISL